MGISPARRASLEVLGKTRSQNAWAHEVMDSALKSSSLSEADRAFVTRTTYGTVQTLGTLDEILDGMLDRPSRVHPAVRDILRLAAYEILFDRGDAHAVVSEAVDASRRVAPHSAGMTNAVLRNLVQRAPEFPWGDPATDATALARATGHPQWLVDRIIQVYGHTAAGELLEANNGAAPLYVAHNPFKGSEAALLAALTEDGADPRPTPVQGCIQCGEPAAAVRGQAVANGLAIITDAAAQFVATLASPSGGQVAVDIGSGRGTKSALMARSAAGGSKIIAVDVHEYKNALADRRMKELKVPGVEQITADATDTAALVKAVGLQADIVLVDAPCTGLGALRRMPDKRWRVTPEDSARLAELGGALMRAAAHLVRPGGVMVYSTCTILPEENDDVVCRFASSVAGADFEIEDIRPEIPSEWAGFGTESGYFQSLPTSGGPDGHFAAALRRAR